MGWDHNNWLFNKWISDWLSSERRGKGEGLKNLSLYCSVFDYYIFRSSRFCHKELQISPMYFDIIMCYCLEVGKI